MQLLADRLREVLANATMLVSNLCYRCFGVNFFAAIVCQILVVVIATVRHDFTRNECKEARNLMFYSFALFEGSTHASQDDSSNESCDAGLCSEGFIKHNLPVMSCSSESSALVCTDCSQGK